MELKLRHTHEILIELGLLIVPYGIETVLYSAQFIELLLLIVPYGIETCLKRSCFCSVVLLIVPYGIETKADASANEQRRTF